MQINKIFSSLAVLSILAIGVLVGANNVDAKKVKYNQITIVEKAVKINMETGEFSTLIAALDHAGLVDILNTNNKKFTVFAPTDAAFAEIGLDASNISSVPVADLTDILLYHVSPKKYQSSKLDRIEALTMVNGEMIMFDNGMINDTSVVVKADIKLRNGIMHVIDEVLLP